MRDTTYTATMPDGATATRSSKRAYTHLVVGRYPMGWAPACWTTDPDAALKRAQATIGKRFGFSSGPYKHVSGAAVASEFVVVQATIESK